MVSIVPKDVILRQLPVYSVREWAALREYIERTQPTQLQRAIMMYGCVHPLTRSIAHKIVEVPVYMLWTDNYWQTHQPYNRVSKPSILGITDPKALHGKAILCEVETLGSFTSAYFYYDNDDNATYINNPVFVFISDSTV